MCRGAWAGLATERGKSVRESLDSAEERDRRRFGIVLAVVACIGAGLWYCWTYVWSDHPPNQTVMLPMGFDAEVTDLRTGDEAMGQKAVRIVHEGRSSAQMEFGYAGWPIECRFYAASDSPDRLWLIQLKSLRFEEDPGRWIEALTLEEYPQLLVRDDLVLMTRAELP